jgi:hypothetical protein
MKHLLQFKHKSFQQSCSKDDIVLLNIPKENLKNVVTMTYGLRHFQMDKEFILTVSDTNP